MKKRNGIIVLLILCVCFCVIGLTACNIQSGNNDDNKTSQSVNGTSQKESESTSQVQGGSTSQEQSNSSSNGHKHNFTSEWKTNATEHWHECACGEKQDTASHTLVETEEEKYLKTPATCTAKAVYYKACSVCGLASTETFEYGEMAEHTLVEKVEEKYLKTPATCTAKAVYYKSCSVCGLASTETFEYGELSAHLFGDLLEETPATCFKAGTLAHKDCESCHKHFDKDGKEILDLTIPIDPDAHKFGNWEIVKQANCGGEGEKTRICSLCGIEEKQKIDALPHDWNEPTYEWAADYSSCTAMRTCKNDSSHIETETATTELRTTVEATESAFGECNYVVTFKNAAFIAPVSPTFDVSADGTAYQPEENYEWTNSGSGFVCTVTKVCVSDPSKTITETASITLEEISPASCTKEGLGRYVATFKNPAFAKQYSNEVVIPYLPHVLVNNEWGTDEKGHWRNCEYGCGTKLEYTDHTAGEWETTIDPTLTYEGEQVKKCTVCGYVMETEVLPKLTNDWNGSAVAGSFEGGTGAVNNPYLIKTGAQMKYLANLINSGTKGYSTLSYRLVDNINLGGYEWEPIGVFLTSATETSTDRMFSGTFDGNGYVVSNFKITTMPNDYYQCYGLFGRVSGGTIKNLGVENFNIDLTTTTFVSSSYCFAGAISGIAINSATITNCYTSNGSVTVNLNNGACKAGGIAGACCESTITYCYSTAVVTATSVYVDAGGVVGEIYSNATMNYCFATGKISVTGKSSFDIGYVYGSRLSSNTSYCYRYENQELMRNGKVYYTSGVYNGTTDLLNSSSFYTGTLKFSSSVWDFNVLDVANGQLPKLKPGITA